MNPSNADARTPDWNKGDGLLPAIVQDADSGRVLMLGYMNEEALERTRATGHVTFFSRSKQRLWTKGETSGHTLELVDLAIASKGLRRVVWERTRTEDGRFYWFNVNTKATSWTKPDDA